MDKIRYSNTPSAYQALMRLTQPRPPNGEAWLEIEVVDAIQFFNRTVESKSIELNISAHRMKLTLDDFTAKTAFTQSSKQGQMETIHAHARMIIEAIMTDSAPLTKWAQYDECGFHKSFRMKARAVFMLLKRQYPNLTNQISDAENRLKDLHSKAKGIDI